MSRFNTFVQQVNDIAQTSFEPAEISEEEKQTVADLMAKLGL